MEPGGRPIVFISYAREDFYLAEQVYAHLLRRGAEPWLDQDRLAPAEPWKGLLKKTIEEQADLVAVVASRRSMRLGEDASYVQTEIELARDSRKPVQVLRADGTALVPTLDGAAVHDLRRGVGRAVAGLCAGLDLPRPEPGPLPARTWSALTVPLLVAGLLAAGLTCLAEALWRLGVLRTPLAELRTGSSLGAAGAPQRVGIIVFAGFFVGCALILFCCALALARRRWRAGYVLPLLAPLVLLPGQAAFLPRFVRLIERYPGPGTAALVRGTGAWQVALFASGGVVLLTVLAGVGSVSVLAASLVGRGSLPARFRVVGQGRPELGRDGALFAVIDSLSLSTEFTGVMLTSFHEEIVWPRKRPRTYRLRAEPADQRLADELRASLEPTGLQEVDGPADRRLVLVSNVNAHVLTTTVDEDDVVVLATPVRIDRESPVLRRQLIDFRAFVLSAGMSLRIVGTDLPAGVRWFPAPVAPEALRMPPSRLMSLAGLPALVFWLAFTLVSDVEGLLAGRPVSVLRMSVIVLTIAAALAVIDGFVGRRRTVPQLRRLTLAAAVMASAFVVITLLDSQIYIVMRLGGAAVGAWVVYPLLRMATEFAVWLPAVPVRAGTARALPRPGRAALLSPYLYVVAMLLLVAVLFRPF